MMLLLLLSFACGHQDRTEYDACVTKLAAVCACEGGEDAVTEVTGPNEHCDPDYVDGVCSQPGISGGSMEYQNCFNEAYAESCDSSAAAEGCE